MNCIYCHKILPNEDGDWRIFRCDNCQSSDWDVRYYTHMNEVGQLKISGLAIFSYQALRYVEVQTIYNEIQVFEVDKSKGWTDYHPMTKLNHLEFLSPTNIQDWLDRLSKIKAFF